MTQTEPPLPPDALAQRLTEVFNLVGPLYRRAQRRIEQDAPLHGPSVGVRAVLDLLHEHGPLTVPQMARILAMSRQFVQRTVNDATERGLVRSIPNPAHQRSSLIQVTDAGRAAVRAVAERERALLGRVPGDLTDSELRACVRVLGSMLQYLGETEPET